MPSPWRADGTLNLTLEDVPVVTVDGRAGHGNRTIPYLINCQKWNDPRLCAFYYNFPVRPCPTLPHSTKRTQRHERTNKLQRKRGW